MSKYQNKDIAEKLGIHPVYLSRLRNGDRKPSLELMRKIRDELGWDLAQQIEVHEAGAYAETFRTFLEEHYDIPQ